MIFNIYGPPASGKTRYSEYFRQALRANRVVDHCQFRKPEIEDGDLVLSHIPIGRPLHHEITHIPIEIALMKIGKIAK